MTHEPVHTNPGERQPLGAQRLHDAELALDPAQTMNAAEYGMQSDEYDIKALGELSFHSDSLEDTHDALIVSYTDKTGEVTYALQGLKTDDQGKKVYNGLNSVTITEAPLVLGRGANSGEQGVLSAVTLFGENAKYGAMVSKHHLSLRIVDNKVVVKDTSTNGTEVLSAKETPLSEESIPSVEREIKEHEVAPRAGHVAVEANVQGEDNSESLLGAKDIDDMTPDEMLHNEEVSLHSQDNTEQEVAGVEEDNESLEEQDVINQEVTERTNNILANLNAQVEGLTHGSIPGSIEDIRTAISGRMRMYEDASYELRAVLRHAEEGHNRAVMQNIEEMIGMLNRAGRSRAEEPDMLNGIKKKAGEVFDSVAAVRQDFLHVVQAAGPESEQLIERNEAFQYSTGKHTALMRVVGDFTESIPRSVSEQEDGAAITALRMLRQFSDEYSMGRMRPDEAMDALYRIRRSLDASYDEAQLSGRSVQGMLNALDAVASIAKR